MAAESHSSECSTGYPLSRGSISYAVNFNGALTDDQLESFRRQSFLNLGKRLSDGDVAHFTEMFERDQQVRRFAPHVGVLDSSL